MRVISTCSVICDVLIKIVVKDDDAIYAPSNIGRISGRVEGASRAAAALPHRGRRGWGRALAGDTYLVEAHWP